MQKGSCCFIQRRSNTEVVTSVLDHRQMLDIKSFLWSVYSTPLRGIKNGDMWVVEPFFLIQNAEL
ncbi:MAG: hypothetical protein IPK10_13975 [Bacteroidetes bacterium]|nr:hypothetical protein [Bacteroidota bacterium]